MYISVSRDDRHETAGNDMRMRVKTIFLWGVIIGVAVGGGSCSSPDPPSESSTSADVDPGDMIDSPTADIASSADTADPLSCPEAPACDDDQRRLSDCTCVSNLDRRCLRDRDCRPDATCEPLDDSDRKVCVYAPEPVQTCPGSEGCDGGGDDVLRAGAASRSVTPRGFERPTSEGVDDSNYMDFAPNLVDDEVWRDCGDDGLCPGDDGYDGPDAGESDGQLQGLWIAGFSAGRPAQYCPEARVGCEGSECCPSRYAHDDIEVQIAALQHDDVTVVFAALDAIGWFRGDVERIRERLAEKLDLDLLIMASTHTHEAPDTVGQWGPVSAGIPARTGRNSRHIDQIYEETADGIREAIESMQPAEARADVLDVGVEGLGIGDSRPPETLTEVAVVRLGGITFFTAPGEVFPETLVGGFPGRKTVRDPVVGDVREANVEAICDEEGLPVENGEGSHPCIVKPDQTNPPDWSEAPEPPYVYEQIPGDHPFFIGLGMDFLGYLVPRYDHEVDDYLSQAPGSHYEETNGAGPELITDWKRALETSLDNLPADE